MRRNWKRIALGIAIVVLTLFHVQGELVRIGFIDNLENIIYDARLRLTMPRTVDDRIVILDIDEKSLVEPEAGGEGQWPWPRNRLALLFDKLFDRYQIAALGCDVVWAEQDNSSGLRKLDQLAANELKGNTAFQASLQELKPSLDYDGLFAQAMKGRAVILGYVFLPEDKVKGAVAPPVLKESDFRGQPPFTVGFTGYTGNLPIYQKNAASGGHFNPHVDDDGIVRRVPMLVKFRDGYYEPLSLAVVRVIIGLPPVQPVTGEEAFASGYGAGLEGLRVGKYVIPVDEIGAALVPYRGQQRSFVYHSLTDVMNDRVPIEQLRGKIALIGASAPGLLDLRATPVDPAYPGVEIHANLIAGILDENIKHRPPYAKGAEFALVLLLGLVLAVWLPLLPATYAILVALTAAVIAVGINLSFFQYLHTVLPLAAVLVMILSLFVLNMAYGFLVEGRSRREITGRFGQYVPPDVVAAIATDPEKASMEGESREMTVLFTDVRGFTTISEGLDPKALSNLMNEFLTPLTEVIYRHHGTIDKYMGDCIMAFWGAPLPDPNHARNGVIAGMEMQRTLKDLQDYFRSKNWPEIRIGVGLNTGRMSVGNMGSRIRLAYTVMGDAVNLASRLEGITKEYGTDIIVGEDTKNAVPDVVFREIDRVRVKGKDTAVAIFEPLGLVGQVDEAKLEEAALFEEALQLYRRQEWDMAEKGLMELKRRYPDAVLYDTFLEHVAFLRANPPGPGWDGAFTFQTK